MADLPLGYILLAALGLWFLIEGAAYAVFPDEMKRFLEWAAGLAPSDIRTSGIWTAALGALFLYIALRFS